MIQRPQVGIFGRRNVGKSSLINLLSGQHVSIVSDIPGTTTDPVRKIVEIPGIGPMVLIDTAGMDDEGILGEKRVLRSKGVIAQINMAILLFSGNFIGSYEKNLIADFKKQEVPFFMLHNMADKVSLDPELALDLAKSYQVDVLDFTCKEPDNTANLIALIEKNLGPSPNQSVAMLDGMITKGQTVLLVCPVDSEAPQGRLILPQAQVIRELLDIHALAVVLQPDEVESYFHNHEAPALVVVDSQLFGLIEKRIPATQPLTGFSLLLARTKGSFNAYVNGVKAIDALQDGDHILLLEACSHHATCEDIGRVKLPKMLRKYTGKELYCEMVSGLDLPHRPLNSYALIIQCGGCMITQRQVMARIKDAQQAGVPIANYGMSISYMQGVFSRAMAPLLAAERQK